MTETPVNAETHSLFYSITWRPPPHAGLGDVGVVARVRDAPAGAGTGPRAAAEQQYRDYARSIAEGSVPPQGVEGMKLITVARTDVAGHPACVTEIEEPESSDGRVYRGTLYDVFTNDYVFTIAYFAEAGEYAQRRAELERVVATFRLAE